MVWKGIEEKFENNIKIKNMKIAQNAVVEFSYELEVDGQVVDQCPKERPLDYIHGTDRKSVV